MSLRATTINPDVPDDLNQLVIKATQKAPEQRFRHGAEIVQFLGGATKSKFNIDEAKQIVVEADKGKRDLLIKQAYDIAQNQDWAYVPLHQQALAWGVSNKVKVVQRPDNQILFYWFRKE